MQSHFKALLFIIMVCCSFEVLPKAALVMDVNTLKNDIKEKIDVSIALHHLMDELSLSQSFINETIFIQQSLEELHRLAQDLEYLDSKTREISEYDISKFRLLSEQIKSLADHISNIKTLILSISSGLSAKSLTAGLHVLRENRQRKEREFRVRQRIIEAKANYQKRKNEIKAQIAVKKQIDHELNLMKKEQSE